MRHDTDDLTIEVATLEQFVQTQEPSHLTAFNALGFRKIGRQVNCTRAVRPAGDGWLWRVRWWCPRSIGSLTTAGCCTHERLFPAQAEAEDHVDRLRQQLGRQTVITMRPVRECGQ